MFRECLLSESNSAELRRQNTQRVSSRNISNPVKCTWPDRLKGRLALGICELSLSSRTRRGANSHLGGPTDHARSFRKESIANRPGLGLPWKNMQMDIGFRRGGCAH